MPSGLVQLANSAPADHRLPNSFYLSKKPSWWGNMPWPAIGPDVTGGDDPTGTSMPIRRLCYRSAPRTPHTRLTRWGTGSWSSMQAGTIPLPLLSSNTWLSLGRVIAESCQALCRAGNFVVSLFYRQETPRLTARSRLPLRSGQGDLVMESSSVHADIREALGSDGGFHRSKSKDPWLLESMEAAVASKGLTNVSNGPTSFPSRDRPAQTEVGVVISPSIGVFLADRRETPRITRAARALTDSAMNTS